MELIWYSGLSLWFLSFVRCQDNYQPSTFHDYDQEYAPGTQGLQYDPSDTHYPLSSRQNNLLPLGLAAVVGIGAAAVGVAFALQAANARNILTNNVMAASASATNLNDILTAQTPILTGLVMTQAPIDPSLTSLCNAAATIGALATLMMGDALAITGPVVTSIQTALGAVNCV